MPLARVLQKGRITIPKAVRHILDISEGDLVDFEISGQTVILRPRVFVEQAETELFANIRRMHERIGDADPEVMEKAIDASIQKVREEKRRRER
jgi:AbrB family looped-hinge helix DNA binding protein